MLKTIIVALDCSDISEKVISALQQLKIDSEAKIILSHIFSPSDTEDNFSVDRPHKSQEDIYRQVEAHLHNYQLELPNSQLEILSGDPAVEIIRIANIYQADLIVIGTRGLKGFKRIIEGSVSSQVVAEATCSVLVVKN